MNFAQAVANSAPPRSAQVPSPPVSNHLQWGIYLTAKGVSRARDDIRAALNGIADDKVNTIIEIMCANQSEWRRERMRIVEIHFPSIAEQERAFGMISDEQTRSDAHAKMNAMRQALVDGIGNGVRRPCEFGLTRLQKSLPSWNQRSFEDFQGWLLGERTNLCNLPGAPLEIMATATAVIVGIGNLHSHSKGPDELSPEETRQLCDAIRQVIVNAGAIFNVLHSKSLPRDNGSPTRNVNWRRGSGSIDVTDVDDLARVTRWMKDAIKPLRETFQGHFAKKTCILTDEPADHDYSSTDPVLDVRRVYPLYGVLPCTFVERCEKHLDGSCPLAHDPDWRSWLLPLLKIKLQYCTVRDRCGDQGCFKSHSAFELRHYDSVFMTRDCDPRYCRGREVCRHRHGDDQADRKVIYHAVRTEYAIASFKARN